MMKLDKGSTGPIPATNERGKRRRPKEPNPELQFPFKFKSWPYQRRGAVERLVIDKRDRIRRYIRSFEHEACTRVS